MKAKSMASMQYAANQFGMNNGPKRPKKNNGGGQEVSMSCSEHGCSAYDSGSGRSGVGQQTNRQNRGGAKGLSTKAQYKSKVVNKEKEAKKMEKIRADIKKANTPKKLKSKF